MTLMVKIIISKRVMMMVITIMIRMTNIGRTTITVIMKILIILKIIVI